MTKRIFIVDDDLEALQLVGLMLERKGYQIQAASSGEQALQKISEAKAKPDLIILDIMMPDMDGYEVAQHLRDQPETQETPILFFTAKSAIANKIAGFQAGGDDYLTKPIHPAEMLSRVEALLKRSAQQTSEPERGKAIAFLPAKGGLGNSTLALNTAITLSEEQEKKKTLVVESREGGGSIALQLGSSSTRGLQGLLNGSSSLTLEKLDAQLIRHSANLYILPASSKPAGIAPPITGDFVERLLSIVLSNNDYVLFDLPPRIDQATELILQRAAYILITMEPNPITLQLVKGMLAQLERLNIGNYKIKLELIYRAPSASAIKRETIKEQLGFDILGSIPPAPDLVYESWITNRPIVTMQSMSLISQQVKMLVEDILKTV
jgi:DNA-binding response OmpR family regulator